jgi:hypothetical protein
MALFLRIKTGLVLKRPQQRQSIRLHWWPTLPRRPLLQLQSQ